MWQEEFEKTYNILYIELPEKIADDFKNRFKSFIQTEVIEKLIEDIPDRGFRNFEVNKKLKQQLKAKWEKG